MKAAMVVDAKKMVITDVEEPKRDGYHVIMKPTCVGICGSDIHMWELGFLPQYKNMVMGHEHAGIVVDPGNRTDLKEGDRITTIPLSAPCGHCVMCMEGKPQLCEHRVPAVGINNSAKGTYAQLFSSEPSLVRKVPDHMKDEEAAMIEPAATPYAVTKDLGIKRGDRVLIAGGGIIGALAAQWCKYWGADYVCLTEVNEFRMNKNKEDGFVDEVVNALDPEVDKKLWAASQGKGFDYFLECTGTDAAFQTGMKACRVGGTVAIVGVAVKPYQIQGLLALAKHITIKAYLGYSVQEFDEVLDLIARKEFAVMPQYTSDTTLDEVEEKFNWLQNKECTDVKIMIKQFD